MKVSHIILDLIFYIFHVQKCNLVLMLCRLFSALIKILLWLKRKTKHVFILIFLFQFFACILIIYCVSCYLFSLFFQILFVFIYNQIFYVIEHFAFRLLSFSCAGLQSSVKERPEMFRRIE